MFELSLFKLLVWVAWGGVAVWFFIALVTLWGLARYKPLQPLAQSRELTRSSAPFVSILVPARNEEGRVLSDCIHSLLAQEYGRFEIIAVNDRSTDATGAILQSSAKTDERLRVIEGRELPAGWLGKPYAMQQALDAARGEWVLATDADMIFDKAALRTAIAYTLEHQVDALTFIPLFEAHSFWERVMIPAWSWAMLVYILFSRAGSPRSRAGVGIGGFFLIRRAALERVGGYQKLRDEVMEDVRLADMLKSSGARVAFEYATALVRTRMYTNWREMWECSTKNWFSGMKFSISLALSSIFSMYIGAVAPPLIALGCVLFLAAGANTSLWLLFFPLISIWVIEVFILGAVSRRFKIPVVYALSSPLALALLYTTLLDSTIKIVSGKGVTWKGRKVYERAGGVRPPRSRQHVSNLPTAND
ncbi:MAG TPA: glycosyltransferase family 2 protein [Pyrinomonadaceae bacterium]